MAATHVGQPAQPSATRLLYLKYVSLALLVPHTIAYTLLASIARRPNAQGDVFFGPSAVMMMELGKLLVSVVGVAHDAVTTSANAERANDGNRGEYIAIAIADRNPQTSAASSTQQHANFVIDDEDVDGSKRHSLDALNAEMSHLADGPLDVADAPWNGRSRFDRVMQTIKEELLTKNGLRLIPPALLYVCQNNLQVFSSGNLTPAEYQVVGQTKLAFTAIFSVLILKRQLNWKHWLSIATLAIGTTIVQTISARQLGSADATTTASIATATATATAKATVHSRTQHQLLVGTLAMLTASACSGLGGVLIEVLLKQKMPFWTTNSHLAFFSLLPSAVPVLSRAVMSGSFVPLQFFTTTVWCLIALNILGGIIASMTMKYADNILKNFAVAISLIGTIYFSTFVSGVPATLSQVLGTALVVGAIAGYARA